MEVNGVKWSLMEFNGFCGVLWSLMEFNGL